MEAIETITISKNCLEAIKEHTLRCYPMEMCGVIQEDNFIPIENIHEEPINNFKLNTLQLAKVLQKAPIKAIIHSHCDQLKAIRRLDLRTPSLSDMKGQKESGITWYIIGTEGENVTPLLQIPRIPSNEYIGREFIWYINDCYTIIQDYYLFELGITLPDAHYYKEFSSELFLNNIFDNYIEEYGFKIVKFHEIQNGDILLFNYNRLERNHLGIYHNGNVIHQNILSVSVPVSEVQDRIAEIYRHESLCI